MKINLTNTWKSFFLAILFLVFGLLISFIFTKDCSLVIKFLSSLLYVAYFVFIFKRSAQDVLWSIISLPFGFFIFYLGAGSSIGLAVLLSIVVAYLTLLYLPWILYRG
ncbi:hypothetical protein [Candidatus Oleimmundimicrobium sp.]|uniref:hypothetical protein n=1 Tax=Candidatus Oleimmundimicrobium sp. TaxID=3060597 RepID=UPI0027238E90|nr:hypothetical protein [Candidatus Oleimmundimicrobium sp.]MDO8886112.1 hypothetical protein [Candidatus Oleimmundimicrobium sp.]